MTLVVDTSALQDVSRTLQELESAAEHIASQALASPLGEGYSRLRGLDTTGTSLGWVIDGQEGSASGVFAALAETLGGMRANIDALHDGLATTDSDYAAAFDRLDATGSDSSGGIEHAPGYDGVRTSTLRRLPLVVPVPTSFDQLVGEMSTTRYPDPPVTNTILQSVAVSLADISQGLASARDTLLATGFGDAVDAAIKAFGALAAATSTMQSNISSVRDNLAALYGAQWGSGLPAMIAEYKVIDDTARVSTPETYPLIHAALATSYQRQATALLLPAQPRVVSLTTPIPPVAGATFETGGGVAPPAEAVQELLKELPWPQEQRSQVATSLQEIQRATPSSEGLVQEMLGHGSPVGLADAAPISFTLPERPVAANIDAVAAGAPALGLAPAPSQFMNTPSGFIPSGTSGPTGSGAPLSMVTAGGVAPMRSTSVNGARGGSLQASGAQPTGIAPMGGLGTGGRSGARTTSRALGTPGQGLPAMETVGASSPAGQGRAGTRMPNLGGDSGLLFPGAAGNSSASGNSRTPVGVGGHGSHIGSGGMGGISAGAGGAHGRSGAAPHSSGFGYSGQGPNSGGVSSRFNGGGGADPSNPAHRAAGVRGAERGSLMAGPMAAPMAGAGSRGSRGEAAKAVITKIEREGNMKALLGEATPTVPGVIGAWVFERPDQR